MGREEVVISRLCVVFRGGTRIYTGLNRGVVGWGGIPRGIDGAWHHCIGAWELSVLVIPGFSWSPVGSGPSPCVMGVRG